MRLQDDDKAAARRRKSPTNRNRNAPGGTRPAAGPRARKASGDVGRALRAAYHEVVEERIPPEMLDLLGKLG